MCDFDYVWNMKSVDQKVAEEMTAQTSYTVTVDMIVQVGEHSSGAFVYVAQCGNVTVLCLIRPDGECVVKSVAW